MNKKIIFLGLVIFLLCGCSAQVNLTVDNDKIAEEISFNYFSDENIDKEKIKLSFRQFVPVYNDVVVADTEPDEEIDGIKYYTRTLTDIGSGYNFKYKYDYAINNYGKARSVKRSFKSSFIEQNKNENIVTISTDNSGLLLMEQYPNLSSVTINIITDNEVIETNGIKNGNKYSWIFDRNDYKKNIYIKYKIKDKTNTSDNTTNIIDSNKKNEEEKNDFIDFINKHPIVVALVALVIFVLLVLIITKITKLKYE